MENPIKMDDLGGTPIFGNTQVFCLVFETTIGGFLVQLFVFQISPENMLKMMFCLLTTLFFVMFIQGP